MSVACPGFGTFPLYYRKPATHYPPPPPTPSCGGCNVTEGQDAKAERELAHFNYTTDADCCARCRAEPQCDVFVRGLFDYTSGPPTCFLLAGAKGAGTTPKRGRAYGCPKK
eukprot:SAG22_NODE_7_length_40155_cov_25.241356_23_plen_111_part_00